MATTGTVKQQSNWPDGRMLVSIEYVTDAGDVVRTDAVLPQSENLTTWIAARIPEIDASLVEQEINQVLG